MTWVDLIGVNEPTYVGSSRRTPIVYKSAPLVASARRESSGFLANVYGGLTSGLGFGMAQRLVEGIFGPRQIETIHQDTTVASRNGDKCEFYANELQQVSE